MPTTRRTTFARTTVLAGALLVLTACGGATADPAPTTITPTRPDGSATAPESSAIAPAASTPTSGGVADLAALTSTDWIGIALGEVPTPICEHSTAFGPSDTCRWTTSDGTASLSVERTESAEMPTLEAFTTRMTETLGVDEPIEDLGEYALVGDDPLSGGIRIATWIGDGTHLWVVLAVDGDRDTLIASGANIAAGVIAGL